MASNPLHGNSLLHEVMCKIYLVLLSNRQCAIVFNWELQMISERTPIKVWSSYTPTSFSLRGVEWVHCLFLFPLFYGKYGCHMQNWVFLRSLGTLLQKNVIVFFFGNHISNWRSFKKKRLFFGLLFTFFSHKGKVAKIPSARISLTYIHVFCSPY